MPNIMSLGVPRAIKSPGQRTHFVSNGGPALPRLDGAGPVTPVRTSRYPAQPGTLTQLFG